jgi:UDP-N-acetylglucosamine:LPS N-acetylglucosamine transferase
VSRRAPGGDGSRRRILAVSSGGGHWVQLNRTTGAFEGHEVVFVTIDQTYQEDVPDRPFHVVNDATRWNPLGVVRLGLGMFWILLRERPDVVFSTGAAPGCLAIILGKLLRAKTIWLDSVANIEQMSMSGRLVRFFADLWLTQWPHLATDRGPEFAGRVF